MCCLSISFILTAFFFGSGILSAYYGNVFIYVPMTLLFFCSALSLYFNLFFELKTEYNCKNLFFDIPTGSVPFIFYPIYFSISFSFLFENYLYLLILLSSIIYIMSNIIYCYSKKAKTTFTDIE